MAKALIVGGGFFGCCIGLYYRSRGFDVVVLEESGELLNRASYVNQARIHNGYHYPRSLLTALRSRVNFPVFVEEFAACAVQGFTKVYPIAQNNSNVNAHQFLRFCKEIGAPARPAPKEIRNLFDRYTVEETFLVKECAFNSRVLRDLLVRRMESSGVEVRLHVAAERVRETADGRLAVTTSNGEEVADKVVNCTYSRINTFLRASDLPVIPMKHEIAEVALVEPAPEFAGMGITVMDGPFWSSMPFPSRGLHSLTHVRYTPHENWLESEAVRDPYAHLRNKKPQSRALYMQRDAERFMPSMRKARLVDSLFEVKTVLPQNEGDDGRPILYRPDYGLPGLSIIMGGKIDNVYDILEAVRQAEGVLPASPLSPFGAA